MNLVTRVVKGPAARLLHLYLICGHLWDSQKRMNVPISEASSSQGGRYYIIHLVRKLINSVLIKGAVLIEGLNRKLVRQIET